MKYFIVRYRSEHGPVQAWFGNATMAESTLAYEGTTVPLQIVDDGKPELPITYQGFREPTAGQIAMADVYGSSCGEQ